ncbi:MAG: hypothetical protein AAF805_05660, partial [Planctomycetota bacterium]
PTIEVIKVGGSLLSLEGGRERIAAWLARERSPAVAGVLIAGGGPVVDGLRRVCQRGVCDDWAHWAAIRAMDDHTALLASWLPTARLTESPDVVDRALRPRDWALRVGAWLRRVEPGLPGPRLTTGWATTSDAIAARVAVSFGGDVSLALLKSCKPGEYRSEDAIAALAADGVIDPETPRIARPLGGLRIVCP